MKRLVPLVVLICVGFSCQVSVASAAFGVSQFSLGFSKANEAEATQAGSHPYSVTNIIQFNSTESPTLGEVPDGLVRDIEVGLPGGLVGRPTCSPMLKR